MFGYRCALHLKMVRFFTDRTNPTSPSLNQPIIEQVIFFLKGLTVNPSLTLIFWRRETLVVPSRTVTVLSQEKATVSRASLVIRMEKLDELSCPQSRVSRYLHEPWKL